MVDANPEPGSSARQWPFPAYPNGWFAVAYSDDFF